MAEAAPNIETKIPLHERVLAEVDSLRQHFREDGSYPHSILEDTLQNLKTRVQEGAMPYAISETVHPYDSRLKTYMFAGKTAVQMAMNGYNHHHHESAHKRVDIEVDEARHAEQFLRPGTAKLFISPKMTGYDADLAVAEQENLANADAVRMSWAEHDEDGQVSHRAMQSLLVKDIPLQAWIDMLQDPSNMFGKAIELDDTKSALSVMQVHRELELPLGTDLTDVLRSVVEYIEDTRAKQKVERHIQLFACNQQELNAMAEEKAENWLEFETELVESLHNGYATFEIQRFIISLQDHWNQEDLQIIRSHDQGSGFAMTRNLARILEEAKENTIWAETGVLVGNEDVLRQIDERAAQQVIENHQRLHSGAITAQEAAMLQANTTRLVASQNVDVGGGCAGTSSNKFGDPNQLDQLDADAAGDDSKDSWTWKQGVCRVEACSTRPGQTMVGPCSVCKDCQHDFDRGVDPTKKKPSQQPRKADGTFDGFFKKKSDQKDGLLSKLGVFAGTS